MSEEKDRIEWWYEWSEEWDVWGDDDGPCPDGLLEWFDVPEEAREMWFVVSREYTACEDSAWMMVPAPGGWHVWVSPGVWMSSGTLPHDVDEDLRELSGEGSLWAWIEWR